MRAGTIEPAEMIRADGRVLRYQCIALPDGGRMMTYFDITDLKEKELEIAEKEAQLRIAMDNMPGALVYTDKNVDLVVSNSRFGEMYRIPDSLLEPGKSYVEVLRYLTERGDYGDGVGEDEVRRRVESLRDPTDVAFLDRPPWGSVNQVIRQPVEGGGTVTIVTDVTERVKAEEALAEKEAQLRSALDNMTDGMYLLDSDLKFVLYNDRYRDLVDLPEDAIAVGGDVAEAVRAHTARGDYGPGRPDQIVRERLEGLRKREAGQIEMVIHGGEKYLELRKAPIEDGGAVVTISDITERKKAEQEIALKEAQLRLALGNMSDGLFMLDRQGRYQIYNDHYMEFVADSNIPTKLVKTGASIYEVLLHAARNGLYGEGDPEEQARMRVDGLTSPDDVRLEVTTPSGHWYELRKSGGTEAGSVVTLTNVTEQKLAQQEIAEKEALLRLAMDNMPGGLSYTDEELNIAVCNANYAELLELPTDLMRPGGHYIDVLRFAAEKGDLGPGDIDKLIAKRIDTLRNPPSEPIMIRLSSGRVMNVQRQRVEQGGVVSIATDITARVKAEEALTDAYEVISSSIQYASRIQPSILPYENLFDALFADHFVHWEPRDVVGGDIYWSGEWQDGAVVMLGDCTGHGVPGAFMTLIAIGALDRAMNEVEQGDVAGLVRRMHQLVQITLNQHAGGGESDDGMEMGICYVHPGKEKMTFVGTRFSMFVLEDGKVEEIKGDKKGIGYRGIPQDQDYTEIEVAVNSGRRFYLTTDGLIDQIGGERQHSFGKRRFLNVVKKNADKPFEQQR